MNNKDEKLNLLSPIVLNTNDEGINNYFELLKRLINEPDARNIAITGNYGSGKSSIVKTYQKKYEENNKSTVISMASFLRTTDSIKKYNSKENIETKNNNLKKVNHEGNNDLDALEEHKNQENRDNQLNPNEEKLVDILEKSIVRFLVYQIGYKKSKLSNVKKPLKSWELKYSIYSIMAIYVICYILLKLYKDTIFNILNIYFFQLLTDSIYNYLLKQFPYDIILKLRLYAFSFDMLALFSIIFIFFELLKNLLIMINHKKTKIKVQNETIDSELEVDNDTNQSCGFSFLKYMYEIVYYFMNSNVDTIFFEDIDRYGDDVCIKILEDLRELNIILNNCEDLNKKITFVYSMKDSTFFTPEQRTKYFDYIIPVLPISTSYNSKVIIKNELLNNSIVPSIFDIELIDIFSYHVKDIRIIKSIINDYILLDKIIKSTEKNKMLAMCIFKNKYIHEYDKLNETNNKIEKAIDEIKNKIKNESIDEVNYIDNEIKEYRSLSRKNSKEVKELLLYRNRHDNYAPEGIYSERLYKVETFLSDDFDINIMNNAYINVNGHIYPINYEGFENKEKFISEIEKYTINIDKLEKRKKELNEKLNNKNYFIEQMKIKYRKKENRDLLNDLIYCGFIDENYANYTTAIVNNNSLTGNDVRFMNNINNKVINFDLETRFNENILENIDLEELNGIYILNVHFIKGVMNLSVNNKKYENFVECIISQFQNVDKIHLDFLNYIRINYNEFYNEFIRLISKYYDSIWNKASSEIENFSDYDSVLLDIILSNKIVKSKLQNIDKLKGIIEKNNSINIIGNNIIRNNIKTLNIKYKDINSIVPKIISTSNLKNKKRIIDNYNEVIKFIVKNNLYEININNIERIVNSDRIEYSVIGNSEYHSQIINYLKSNIEESYNNLYHNTNILMNSKRAVSYCLKEFKNDSEKIDEIIMKENIKFNSIIFDIPHDSIEIAYLNDKFKVDWKLIEDLLKIVPKQTALLENIIVDNIDYLLNNLNDDVIKSLNPNSIMNIINELYKEKKYNHAETLLDNYDTSLLKEKTNIKKTDSPTKIDTFVNNDMVKYNDKNYQVIKSKCNRTISSLYKSNWEKSDRDNLSKKKWI